MTRFVVDCDVVLRLASEGIDAPAKELARRLEGIVATATIEELRGARADER